tara:strand:- start:206 stop:724 length:519 start_codon:yes stop_codon:yes gene_type:complete
MKALRLFVAVSMLLGALALPMSCSSTSEAAAQVEHVQNQLQQALVQLSETQDALALAMAAPPGETDGEQIAVLKAQQVALQETVTALTGALQAAVEDMPDAWKADWENWKEGVEGNSDELVGGLLSIGGAQGGLIGIASTILLSLWRDRRKRKGHDPLQRADVFTPGLGNPS